MVVETDGASEDDDLFDAGLTPQRFDGGVDARRMREVDDRRQPHLLRPVEKVGDELPNEVLVATAATQLPDLRQVLVREGLQTFEEHVLLRREVVVDGCCGHVGRGGDVGDRDAIGRMEREEAHRGVDDGTPSRRTVWRPGHRCSAACR